MRTAARVTVLSAVLTLPALAHHSVRAEYDTTRQISLVGTVRAIRWLNPHGEIDLRVVGEDQNPIEWSLQIGSPNRVMRKGMRRDSVVPGDAVVVTGVWPARDGSSSGSGGILTLTDGTRFDVYDGRPGATSLSGFQPVRAFEPMRVDEAIGN